MQAYTHRFSCPGVSLTSDCISTVHHYEELENEGCTDIRSIDIIVGFAFEWLDIIGARVNLPPGRFAFRSWHGTWLRGCPDVHVDISPHLRDCEVWTLRNAGEGKVSVTSVHGSVLWCCGSERMLRLRKGARTGTQWRVKAASKGCCAFVSPDGFMLQGYPGGDRAKVAPNACEEDWTTQTWEQWKLVPV